jgi:hypothetical protein
MTARWIDMDWTTAARHPEWWIDVLVGHTLEPSDAVVVSGFWRSGTTWLQQSISQATQAKTVLEPLYSEFEPYRRAVLDQTYGSLPSRSFRIPFMPYTGNDLDGEDLLRGYLHQALVSTILGVHVRTARYDTEDKHQLNGDLRKISHRLRDASRSKVVVKFTRAHLLLTAIHHEFNSTVLHIRRDPRAVVASILRTHWDWPADLSLVEQLLEVQDGRDQLFQGEADALRELDRRGVAARLAGYWVCVERCVKKLEEENRVISVSYEELVRRGEDYLESILPAGMKAGRNVLSEESASTQPERKGASESERLYGWRKELSDQDIEQINHALDVLGYKYDNGLMKHER